MRLQGNVTRKEDVAATITDDCVGVVVALGGRPNDVGETMLRDGTTNVIEVRRAQTNEGLRHRVASWFRRAHRPLCRPRRR